MKFATVVVTQGNWQDRVVSHSRNNMQTPVHTRLLGNTCYIKSHSASFAAMLSLCAECSSCPHRWFPYCANSAQYGPSTFANCCYAKCNNVPIIKSVLHAGVCLDKCGKCDPTLERPLCCKGRTYKNGCYATCNEEDTNQCSLGRCSTSKQLVTDHEWGWLLVCSRVVFVLRCMHHASCCPRNDKWWPNHDLQLRPWHPGAA